MWEPRRLTIILASKVFFRDRFTFFIMWYGHLFCAVSSAYFGGLWFKSPLIRSQPIHATSVLISQITSRQLLSPSFQLITQGWRKIGERKMLRPAGSAWRESEQVIIASFPAGRCSGWISSATRVCLTAFSWLSQFLQDNTVQYIDLTMATPFHISISGISEEPG
jgi:hypothetical protein